MKPADHATFAVIVNDQLQFDVWSTRRKLLPGWIYAGPTGTREEMQTLLRLQASPPRQRKVARTTARD